MIMPMLAVSNITASLEFYQNVLGFEVTVSMPGEDGTPWFAIVQKGAMVQIGLGVQPNGESTEGFGKGVVLMLYVPEGTDMEAYFESVKEKGAPIAEALKVEYWGDQLFSVTDPDGYYLSLCKTVKQMTADEIAASRPVAE